ncbi:LysR substrate-binding domain-containing protein [Insolitispirillum peregrinum]|uniref:Transcriptional regulator, LysR family n=1 Tax=Insolitispirillum peregrinum TaxID=80876 RepID=A0A1N7JLV4_9PROT|nr:LysR substrate-binding domain-containing protein [Insolitispirillum peregrinum]SIS50308.1 transcriptional regulator, LysR family [Insolitispirillum peregrinum]
MPRLSVELRRIRYFLAVAETLHFGRAAERLGMAQPPLSEQIRKLEEELEVTLFVRNTRTVALTDAGAIFLAGARRAMDEMERAAVAARQAERGIRGHLVLGFVSSASVTVLPKALGRLRTSMPDLELDLRQYRHSRDVIESLLQGEVDIAVTRPSGKASISEHILLRDRVLVAYREDHPLAALDEITPDTLREELFVLFPPYQGNVVNSVIGRICQASGFTPRPAHFVDDVYAMLGLVAAGTGIALLPESLAKLAVSGVAYRPLSGSNETMDLCVAWRRNETAHRLLLHHAVNQILESQGLPPPLAQASLTP